MAAELKRFAPGEIKISFEEAARILKFFFPDAPIAAGSLTSDDLSFAQGLLVEAIDASSEMAYVQRLYEKTFMKPPTDFTFIKDVAKSLAKQALTNWFRHATGKDLQDPQIYESVRRTISRNFRSVWAIRLSTGELTY
jgi:hypothetical protein